MNYKHIFSSDYQREAFAGVINDIFTDKFERLKDVESIKADKSLAKDACRIGKIITSDKREIAVYEVLLQDGVQLSRNRVAIRNLLRNSWKDYDGAFIAGYQDKNPEWRFSFLSETKELGADGYLEKRATQAKRYTYLLGGDNVHRTAVERFCKLKDSKKELKDIIDAFSVEALSDEFFKAYKEQYIGFCDFIYENKNNAALFGAEFATWSDKTVRDYVKKMLGRLVFLCFLQKKGWLGVAADKEWGSGDHNFLQSLFTKASDKQKTNFLDEVLEPLFFNCLNEKRIDDIFDTMVTNIGKVKIPYLNGGLFEKDEIDKPKSRFPEEMFGGLFEFFARYNFTIDENDPQDAEVGVDPEMLGKIFENLLEDNKDKGAFYTPKEIVQYMCNESLISYLVADSEIAEEKVRSFVMSRNHDTNDLKDSEKEKLKERLISVKICDPAVGSGAFPMGMLNLLFECRIALGELNENRAEIKKDIVHSNIYGVDIEKGAVDIARLRFWLAIIVDEKKPIPLPNLDYKIMQGNSLLESYNGVDLSMLTKYDLFGKDEVEALTKAMDEYYISHDNSRKENIKKTIEAKVIALLKARSLDVYRDLSKIDLHSNREFFLWHTWFGDVFKRPNECNGFDIVIGNPPYGAKISENEKSILKATYQTAKTIKNVQKGSMDSYTLFIEEGYKLLKNNGNLTYIVPLSFTSSDSLIGVHKLLMDNCKTIRISSYAVRPEPVFKNAVIDTSIIMFNKTLTPCKRLLTTKMYRKKGSLYNLQNLIDKLQFAEVKNLRLLGRIPKISLSIEQSILQKIFKYRAVREFKSEKGNLIFYRTSGGRYFKIVTNYSTGSTKEKSISLNKKFSNALGCALSSNLSFWFYQIHSNNHDWKNYEIESFPIPNLSNENIVALNTLYAGYLTDIEKNAKVRVSSGKSSYRVDSFKEYKIVKSKHIIDKIDDYICPLYGLTEEETAFIKNYEMLFRMSGEE